MDSSMETRSIYTNSQASMPTTTTTNLNTPLTALSVIGGQPFQSKHEDRPSFNASFPFPQNPFPPPPTYQHLFDGQILPDHHLPPTPTEVIGSSLEEMGKSLSQAAVDLKLGLVNPTIPILQDLVHKITTEVDRLTPSFDGLSLGIQQSFPIPQPPLVLVDPSALPIRNKRPASPLSLDPTRPQKSQRPMKVEPTDEPLNRMPLSSALPPPSFLPSPPILTPLMNPSMVANPFDMPISDAASSAQPSQNPWGSSGPSGPIRHHHSLSAGSIVPRPLPPQPNNNNTSASASAIGRAARSGSFGNNYPPAHLTFDYGEPFNSLKPPSSQVPAPQWPVNVPSLSPSELLPQGVAPPWCPMADIQSPIPLPADVPTPNDEDDGDAEDDAEDDDYSGTGHSPDSTGVSAGDIPSEYQTVVDRIFFDFLNSLCSNLDATDSKGEPIHQTLMAKKMKRLDESGDFRPFKFRIAAFTSKFLERLAEEGYPEDKIPMKKVRNYLWHQPYILRFNEEGKKAKSKGNHIWNIDARKISDRQWDFRPFQRRLAGFPSGIAYRGLPWSYAARIWDPQSSWQNVPVTYHSPHLPSWLCWKDNVLSGVPNQDAVSCDITVIAKYNYHGQEGQLSHNFHLNVAPQSMDTARRTNIVAEQRPLPDDMVPRSRENPPSLSARSDIIFVMENVKAQASNDLGAHAVSDLDYQNLVKQAHVLEKTVSALADHKPHTESQALSDAANGVVTSAAKMVSTQLASTRLPSMNEVSCLTKAAISEAVLMNGTRSNEIDIIRTAHFLLKPEQTIPTAYSAVPLAGPV